jgi:hypothetical protein
MGIKQVTKKRIVRFANPHRPKKASQIKTKLSAVCCPAFSLT